MSFKSLKLDYRSRSLALSLALLSLLATGVIAHAGTNSIPLLNQTLVPSGASPGSPSFTLTVNGTGFVAGSVVQWNGSARTTTFVSTSQLTAQINATDIAVPGTAAVTVASPAPGGGTSNFVYFPIEKPRSLIFHSTSLTAGNGTVALDAADFNGDGKPDLAVANVNDENVSIFLGNGDGTFQPQQIFPVGARGQFMIAADVNGDGKIDLIVTDYDGGTLSVLLGNGDGSFQLPKVTITGFPFAVAAADFNGDGLLDIVVTDSVAATGSILLGNGDGSFQAPVVFATNGATGGIAIGDFNRDGNLDLAVAVGAASPQACDGTINPAAIYLGNGDGTFQPRLTIALKPFQFL